MAFNAKSANALSLRDTMLTCLDVRYTMSSQKSWRTRELRGGTKKCEATVAPKLGLHLFLASKQQLHREASTLEILPLPILRHDLIR